MHGSWGNRDPQMAMNCCSRAAVLSVVWEPLDFLWSLTSNYLHINGKTLFVFFTHSLTIVPGGFPEAT